LSNWSEALAGGDATWCGSGAISETDYAASNPLGLTRFNYRYADLELDGHAIDAVEEHHPGQTTGLRPPREHESALGHVRSLARGSFRPPGTSRRTPTSF